MSINHQLGVLSILALTLLSPRSAQSQINTQPNEQTTTPTNARYEIVQSQLAARWTFRLDRYTGRIAQLVKTADDSSAWEEMTVYVLPTIASPSKPRFQLFTSGLAVRHTYLIDTDTGKTWILVSGKRKLASGIEYEYHSWEPLMLLVDP